MEISLLTLQIKVGIVRQSLVPIRLGHHQLMGQLMLQTENDCSCSSAKKLRLSFESDKDECDNYYILMSFPILQAAISRCKCEFCQESPNLFDNEPFRAGLSHKLSFQCRKCEIFDTFYS